MYNAFIINGSERLKLHESSPNSQIKAMGTIKKGINAIDSFSFTIMSNNPCYGEITNLLSKVEVYRASDGKLVFKGRVLTPTAKMESSGNTSISYQCEGELGYLNDSVQPYQQVNSISDFFEQVLATHNSQVPDDKKIYLGAIATGGTTIRSRTWHYISSWQAISDYIRDYGGEIRLRYGSDGKRYLDYTPTVWSQGSDTKIELAVNMMSVSYTVDPTQVYSGIYPVGAKLYDDGTSAERLELGYVIWLDSLRAKYGDVVACVEFDDITLPANLVIRANAWLRAQSGELHQYTVNAVDLSSINKDYDEFEVGTQYAVKNKLINLDKVIRCVSKVIDLNSPEKTTLTFGDQYETVTDIISSRNAAVVSKINTTADSITRSQSAYAQRIVENQTALLTGAEGGFVYQHLNSDGKPQEIFFLNSADINTATKALRINQNGIGFWDASAQTPAGNAMDGPYKQAWTIDGTFNTDYIVGRRITGFTFDNGDGTFKVQADGTVTAKALTITNGSINCGNGVFTVSPQGAVTASNLTITGGSISGVSTTGGSMTNIAINCGNGAFTVATNGHVVARDIELEGGGSSGGSFEDCYINCGNGVFVVDSSGNVTANSLTSNSAAITGGSINISTSSKTDDVITLSYNDYEITLAPEGVWVSDGTLECTLQAGGISVTNGNKTTIINSTSLLTETAIFEDDIRVVYQGTNYWVGAALKDLYDRI